MTTDRQYFLEKLRALRAAGNDGFEGLIAKLLEKLTGHHFQLARSGYQGGRDFSSSDWKSNIIAVECKRYGADTQPNIRELKGELEQALESIPDLDIWVLVISRDASSQVVETLRHQAQDRGIDFLVISAEDTNPSSLEILAANSSETVFEYIAESDNIEGVQSFLEEIRQHNDFEKLVTSLKDIFLSPLVGYENWRVEQNKKIIDSLSSESQSRVAFGQLLNVNDKDNVNLIYRRNAWQHLDEWINSWTSNKNPMAVLGEEGDGKSWCIASWLNQKLQATSEFPPPLFFSSEQVNDNHPLNLLSNYFEQDWQYFSKDAWNKRIIRWTERKHDSSPILILVLDGINERRDSRWWRTLLEKLHGEPWVNQVAVLITCRRAYWERYFSNLNYLDASTYTLNSYDDTELGEALAYSDLQLSDIDEELFPLIRTPRYFDLMIKYRDKIQSSGDVTRARLIYEDWQHKYAQKNNLEIDPQTFQQVISDLVEKYGERYFSDRNIDDLLPSLNENTATREELSTSRLFHTSPTGRYRINEHYLVYGLGLLLVEELGQAYELAEQGLENVLAEWLEPHAEMDLKASICEFATLHALTLESFPEDAKVALLYTWISNRNPDATIIEKIDAYFPQDPQAYLSLSEIIWLDTTNNPWAQELLVRAFLRWWHDAPDVQSYLKTAFKRWLGFVNVYGFPAERRMQNPSILQQKVFERIGHPIKVGESTELGNYTITGIEDDGLLRLGRVALAIISYLPRRDFVHEISTGLLADEFMGIPAKIELISWILHTASEEIWDEIDSETNQLLLLQKTAANKTAYRLLAAEGSSLAEQKRQSLPEDSYERDPMQDQISADPCRWRFRWSQYDCERCLLREDVSADHMAEQLQYHAVNPDLSVPTNLAQRLESLAQNLHPDNIKVSMYATSDDHLLLKYEPALCAYSLHTIVSFIRDAVQNIDSRENIALRQISLWLKEHTLLFRTEEHNKIIGAWQLLSTTDEWTEEKETAELFLFQASLIALDAENQIQWLAQRSEEHLNFLNFEKYFKSLDEWNIPLKLLDESPSPTVIERVLWFLGVNYQYIPNNYLDDRILELIQHNSSSIRGTTFKLLYQSATPENIQLFINSQWSWQNQGKLEYEILWGSLLLAKYGINLPFSEIKRRIHPAYLGYAVNERGNQDSEINDFIEELDRLVTVILSNAPELPHDLPAIKLIATHEVEDDLFIVPTLSLYNPYEITSHKSVNRYYSWGGAINNENQSWRAFFEDTYLDDKKASDQQRMIDTIEIQTSANNIFFRTRIHPDFLKVILSKKADVFEQWINFYDHGSNSEKYLNLGSPFYASLCQVLFKEGHYEKAVDLYKRIKAEDNVVRVREQSSNVELIDYSFFQSQPDIFLTNEWKISLYTATTDKEWLAIVTLIYYGQGKEWLLSEANSWLESQGMRDKLRGIMTLGFIPDESSRQKLDSLLDAQPDTWLKNYVQEAIDFWNRNDWSMHWYRKFFSDNDDIQAWSAFRLFLKCVDSRFWHWQSAVERSLSDNPEQYQYRKTFQVNNLDTIKNRIQKNEKLLREKLLRHKVMEHEVWPWMQSTS